jgi:hypothetical protein
MIFYTIYIKHKKMINFGNVKSKLNKAYSQDLIDNTNKYKKLYEDF